VNGVVCITLHALVSRGYHPLDIRGYSGPVDSWLACDVSAGQAAGR
jgi:hypothetical protein